MYFDKMTKRKMLAPTILNSKMIGAYLILDPWHICPSTCLSCKREREQSLPQDIDHSVIFLDLFLRGFQNFQKKYRFPKGTLDCSMCILTL
jgi:hypothetical protein